MCFILIVRLCKEVEIYSLLLEMSVLFMMLYTGEYIVVINSSSRWQHVFSIYVKISFDKGNIIILLLFVDLKVECLMTHLVEISPKVQIYSYRVVGHSETLSLSMFSLPKKGK